jgi:hypothetical protein
MRSLLGYLAVATSAALTGCSGSQDAVVRDVPFSATLGSTILKLPDDPAFRRASFSIRSGRGYYVSVDLCPKLGPERRRPLGCEAFDMLRVKDEIHVLIDAPIPGKRSPSISERPRVAEPAPTALLPAPDQRPAAGTGANAGWDYARNRLRVLGPKEISTTERGWPLVACDNQNANPIVTCLTAFAVRDLYVEARWQADRSDFPNQLQAWRIASAVDHTIRAAIE